jgi:hypothetical protein
MSQCAAIKADGTRCKAQAMSGKDQCFTHDPEVAERRQRSKVKGGKTGGRGRPKVRLDNIYAFAQSQLEGLLDRTIDPRRSSVAVQWCHVQIKCLEQERKLVDQAELERKVEVLEELYGKRITAVDSDNPFESGVWAR